MANRLIQGLLNPIKVYASTRAVTAQYQTPHFDQFMHLEQIKDWQVAAAYLQPWQTTDIIYLQYIANISPINAQIVRASDNVVVLTQPLQIKAASELEVGAHVLEVAFALAVPFAGKSGVYYLRLQYGSGEFLQYWVSDYFLICDEEIPGTKLIRYWHDKYLSNTIFETSIKFQRRWHANFGPLEPNFVQEFHRDQKWNPGTVSTQYVRKWNLNFGDTFGISDVDIDAICHMMRCRFIEIDNKLFGLAEGAKPEKKTAEENNEYPLYGFSFQMEEGLNRGAVYFDAETDPNKKVIAAGYVEVAVAGDFANQGSSNEVPVFAVFIEQ